MNTHDKIKLPPLWIPSAFKNSYSKEEMRQYALASIEPYKQRIAELEAQIERLQTIIDSRPAINSGLPQTYIAWSQSIYAMQFAYALETQQ